MGGSLGPVVLVGDSCFKDCGIESRHCTMDGLFSHIFFVKVVKMCIVVVFLVKL